MHAVPVSVSGAGPGAPKAGPSGRGRPAPAGGLAGGGALLETAGLGWRRWVSGGLVAAAAIAAAALALLLPRELHTLLPGAESLGRICSYLTVLVLAACLGLLSMLGLWRDRVREWEGQTVVAEYSGIFRETGYRYVNWFVHGEQVYVWED